MLFRNKVLEKKKLGIHNLLKDDLKNVCDFKVLAIDEGFGVLDRDNMSNISVLLDYLKYQFEFVLIISHLDIVRDMVDNLIDISRKNGYSYVNYS